MMGDIPNLHTLLFFSLLTISMCLARYLIKWSRKLHELHQLVAAIKHDLRNLRVVIEQQQTRIQYMELKYSRMHMMQNQEFENIARALDPAPLNCEGF